MSTMHERLVARMEKRADHDVVAMGRGETFENEKWRVHRYSDSIEVINLEQAGKRGGKCLRMVMVNATGRMSMESLAMEFQMLARRGDSVARMQQAMKEAEQIGGKIHESWLKGVDVKPGGFKPLRVNGIHVTIVADYDTYTITDIADEDVNGTMCMAKGKRSIAQFYRWVMENGKKAQTMTFHDVLTALEKAGIDYHQFCSID